MSDYLIEQHDGKRWSEIGSAYHLGMARALYAHERDQSPGMPIRLVKAESRLIALLHDPRHGYAYPETTT